MTTQNTFDAAAEAAANKQLRHIATNRAEQLEACAPELAEHRANVDQAQANLDALLQRLEELDPLRVEAEAKIALRAATSAGDAEAAQRAARALQELRAGVGDQAVQRLTVGAQIEAARDDLASARASLERAEKAALKTRLDELAKTLDRGLAGYRQACKLAQDRHALLLEVGKAYMKLEAAHKSRTIGPDFQSLERGTRLIEFPSVYVPTRGQCSHKEDA